MNCGVRSDLALVARVAEVGRVSLLVSLPGAAHATLSTRTRGPYCVRPWSCDGQEPECSGAHGCAGAACWADIPVGPKPPVRDTPPTSTAQKRTLRLGATKSGFNKPRLLPARLAWLGI